MGVGLVFGADRVGEAFNKVNDNAKAEIVQVQFVNGNLIHTKFDNSTIIVPLPFTTGQEILNNGYITLGNTSGFYNTAIVSPVDYVKNNQKFSINTSTNLILSNGDSTLDRIDIIYINTSNNTVNLLTGTPALDPNIGALPSNYLLLGAIYVKNNATSLTPNRYLLLWSGYKNQQDIITINNGITIRTLDELDDVLINSVQDQDILRYDASTQKWKNYPLESSTASLVDISYIRANPTTITVGGYPIGSVPNFSTIQTLMDRILYPYVAPTVSLTASSTHERGLTISKTVNYSINLNQGIVATRSIFFDSILVNSPLTNNGSFTSSGLTWANSPNPSALYPTHNFIYYVTFTNNTPLSATVAVDFVAPTYKGVLTFANINETNIKALNKTIRKKDNDTSTTSPTLQRYIYAYDAGFGNLTSILDQNNFNVTGSFTKITQNFTLADGSSRSYNIYYSNDDTTQINFTNKFNF